MVSPMRQRRKWLGLLCSVGALILLFALPDVAWSQKAPGKGVFLSERHKAAGIECARCHKENPPTPVPATVCNSCHANIGESETTVQGKPNPHNAHMIFPECGKCHHIHKPSENQCAKCHNFGYKTP